MDDILVATSDALPGYEIKDTLGMVYGGSVMAKWFGSDFMAGLKDLTGGKIKRYAELMEKVKVDAVYQMTVQAKKLGANAVVTTRFASPEIGGGGKAELIAYGTAVVVKKKAKK